MKKIALEQTQEYKNSELCIATEYDFKDKDIDISTAEINGKYPENGYCVNTEVKEMIYVISGSGKIITESKTITFKQGDAILIDKDEKYCWDAVCKVVMACSPAWTPQQHKMVEW